MGMVQLPEVAGSPVLFRTIARHIVTETAAGAQALESHAITRTGILIRVAVANGYDSTHHT